MNTDTTQQILGIILSGAFYDNVKTATMLSFDLAKNKISELLPIKNKELEKIEEEMLPVNKTNISQDELQKYIEQNEIIQNILKDMNNRKPKKVNKIIKSFNKNKHTKLNISLGKNKIIEESFNGNEDCEINIK